MSENRYSYMHYMSDVGVVSTYRDLPNQEERHGWHDLSELTKSSRQRLMRLFDHPMWTVVSGTQGGNMVRTNEDCSEDEAAGAK